MLLVLHPPHPLVIKRLGGITFSEDLTCLVCRDKGSGAVLNA